MKLDKFMNRARVRLNRIQKDWPEYKLLQTLEATPAPTYDELKALIKATSEARKALKARRALELPVLLELVKRDDESRGMIDPILRTRIKNKWKKRLERELIVSHMQWNQETLDLVDVIDDPEEFYNAEEKRKQEWINERKPEIIANYRQMELDEVRFHGGLLDDWEDVWADTRQEELHTVERRLRKAQSKTAWKSEKYLD